MAYSSPTSVSVLGWRLLTSYRSPGELVFATPVRRSSPSSPSGCGCRRFRRQTTRDSVRWWPHSMPTSSGSTWRSSGPVSSLLWRIGEPLCDACRRGCDLVRCGSQSAERWCSTPCRVWAGGRRRSVIEVHQFLPALFPRDAVGVHTLVTRQVLRDAGMGGHIWAAHRDTSLALLARRYERYPGRHSRSQRLLLYQASTGSEGIADFLIERREPLAVYYHNITPPDLLEPFDRDAAAR